MPHPPLESSEIRSLLLDQADVHLNGLSGDVQAFCDDHLKMPKVTRVKVRTLLEQLNLALAIKSRTDEAVEALIAFRTAITEQVDILMMSSD